MGGPLILLHGFLLVLSATVFLNAPETNADLVNTEKLAITLMFLTATNACLSMFVFTSGDAKTSLDNFSAVNYSRLEKVRRQECCSIFAAGLLQLALGIFMCIVLGEMRAGASPFICVAIHIGFIAFFIDYTSN